ncbi:MAG: hypothetical protein GY801_24715 [bacterium]|nr:hypothetical protein [bacterium]
MKPFSKWTVEEVEDTFQLVLHKENPVLKNWLSAVSESSQEDTQFLEQLQAPLLDHAWDWNEEELKIKFIGPLLSRVNFDQERYQSFWNREISVMYQDEKLAGTVDFVVAQGKHSPKRPYFFINEYKKQFDTSNDPFGQVLIAMVASQKINDVNNPVYGAYVMGRHWYFVVLDGREYAVSLTYDATKDELFEIWGILNTAKTRIEQLLAQVKSK